MGSLQVPPFDRRLELVHDSVPTESGEIPIPNEPCVETTAESVTQLLSRELSCETLDELYPALHLITTLSSANVHPLHDQLAKGRCIKITEEPRLHLIWYYHTIFVKPLPHCLLNHGFWEQYLRPSTLDKTPQERTLYNPSLLSDNCRAALGFIRTYAHLIRHESDFRIAKDEHLIPEHVTYTEFQLFIEPFRYVSDDAVSLRYHYGQIRLTRLNWAVRIFRPASMRRVFPWWYQNLYVQTGQYLQGFAAPLLFLFAGLSLILSSMQVVLAALPQDVWEAFAKASRGFSVTVIILIVGLSLFALLAVIYWFMHQLKFGIELSRDRRFHN
ncbi:hypothetical protein V8E51_008549 [Hyaloscypha variabilis]